MGGEQETLVDVIADALAGDGDHPAWVDRLAVDLAQALMVQTGHEAGWAVAVAASVNAARMSGGQSPPGLVAVGHLGEDGVWRNLYAPASPPPQPSDG